MKSATPDTIVMWEKYMVYAIPLRIATEANFSYLEQKLRGKKETSAIPTIKWG